MPARLGLLLSLAVALSAGRTRAGSVGPEGVGRYGGARDGGAQEAVAVWVWDTLTLAPP